MPRTRSLVVALAVLAAAGCRGRPEPIQVGFVTGLTGRHYDLGISSRNGASLAVVELNQAGGVNGRPIELVIVDDEQRPESARLAVEELIRRGVVAIIGHATSAMAEVTLPIVNRERVLMLSPTVSSSAFVGLDDWFVMLHPSTAESARALAGYLLRTGPIRRVTVFYDLSNRAYTQSWHDHFSAALASGGGRIARSVPFTSGEVPSYEALVVKALEEPTDAVLVVANALDSATICQQVRKASRTLPLLGTEWGFTHDILAHGGAAVDGAVFVQKVDLGDASPRYLRFREAYAARFNRPVDFAAILSYESVEVLAEALRRDASREGVRRAILGIGTFHGLQGDLRIDRYGDVQRRHLVTTLRDGRMSVLE